jgi:hypothetical protein
VVMGLCTGTGAGVGAGQGAAGTEAAISDPGQPGLVFSVRPGEGGGEVGDGDYLAASGQPDRDGQPDYPAQLPGGQRHVISPQARRRLSVDSQILHGAYLDYLVRVTVEHVGSGVTGYGRCRW